MILLEPYEMINQAVGIVLTTGKTGDICVDACQVLVKNKQLHIEKKINGVADMEALGKRLDAAVPVALNLCGKGVLYKQVPGMEEINASNFSSLLPNALITDFYVQHVISGAFSFVSIIRKTDADQWIALFTRQGFRVLMLSLGPFPVRNVLPQLNIYGEEIIFNGNKIQRDEALNWTAFGHEAGAMAPFPLKIENEPIAEQLVLPYAVSFQLVLSDKLDLVQAGVPALEIVFKQVLADRKFKTRGFVILVGCFLLLLLNFGVSSWLDQANMQLTAQVSSSVRNTSDMQIITKHILEKESLLGELGWEVGIRKSILLDQIAALLPLEITWQEVAVDPIDRTGSQTSKALRFIGRRIEIRGLCPQIIPVNEWIARIRAKTWVRDVQLVSYTYNQELDTGQFNLIIAY